MATDQANILTVDEFESLSAEEQESYIQTAISAKYSDLSPEDQQTVTDQINEDPGLMERFGQGAIDAVIEVGAKIDSVTGAPTRAAIGAAMDEFSKPGEADPLGKGLSAFAEQFGEDPQLAPTGKDLATKAGVTDKTLSDAFPGAFSETGEGMFTFQRGGLADISGAGATGLAIDILADPTNVIPVGAAIKGMTKVGKAATGAGKQVFNTSMRKVLEKSPGAASKVQFISKAHQKGVEGVAQVLNPKRAPDFDRLVGIAEKNGIDPDLLTEAVEFGPTSPITRGIRKVAEGPTGETVLQRVDKFKEEVNGALQKKIGEISGGSPLSQTEAGVLIRESIDNATQRIFNSLDVTYGSIGKQNPDLILTANAAKTFGRKLDNLEKIAEGMVTKGVTATRRTQGAEILKVISNVRKSNGNFAQIHEQMQEVGQAAFKLANKFDQSPPDVKLMRDLYGGMASALNDTVEGSIRFGREIGKNLKHNNKVLHDFFTNKSIVTKIAGKDIAPEKVFQSLVSRGDSLKIGALKQIMSEKEFALLKGSFLDDVVESVQGVKFDTLHNRFAQKRNVMNALFSESPQQVQDLQELISLGSRGDMKVLSSSGTGASQSFGDFVAGVRSGFGNEVVIDALKEKARRGAQIPKGQATRALGLFTPKELERLGVEAGESDTIKLIRESLKRGKAERTAKAAQVISVQDIERRKEEFSKLSPEEQEAFLRERLAR